LDLVTSGQIQEAAQLHEREPGPAVREAVPRAAVELLLVRPLLRGVMPHPQRGGGRSQGGIGGEKAQRNLRGMVAGMMSIR